MTGNLLCFGFGYSAQALAHQLGPAWRITGTSRGEPNFSIPADRQDSLLRFDRNHPLDPAIFAGVTHVLVAVPPDEVGDPVFDSHRNEIAAIPNLAWLGYLSTTGVYGDRGGGWVDETSELQPTGERGARRIAAEIAWLGLCRDRHLPVHVFRLAGIYGPARSPFDALRAGTARHIDKPGQVFSRIHVDDLARVLCASIARPRPGAIYNVCDDQPASPAEVVGHAAALLGIPAPPLIPFEAAELSPMVRSFYADNKRVSNALIKQELGVRLRYPSLAADCRPSLLVKAPGLDSGFGACSGLRHPASSGPHKVAARRPPMRRRRRFYGLQRADFGRLLRLALGDKAAVRQPQDHDGLPPRRGRSLQ